MATISDYILSRIEDSSVREETARSIAQRGVLGHYGAGAYRVATRPLKQWYIIQRLRWLNFIWGMDAVANKIERLPARYLKTTLREFGATVADNATILEGMRLSTVHGTGLHHLSIGHSVFIGYHSLIDLSDVVTFGDCCTLTHRCTLFSHLDIGLSPLKQHILPVMRGPIQIGRGAFIGSHTFIAHSTTIGEGAIVGANSFVDKHIPPYTLAVGTPAKVVARINRDNVPAFDTSKAVIVPKGSTPDDFDYDHPRSLKIPDDCAILGK